MGMTKRRKPLILLGFQRFLSSFIFDYFALMSGFSKSLENRLPKRHGGSNPSSCAIKINTIPRGWCLFLSRRTRGREPTSATFCCRMGFAYPTRRSKSSLFRRRVWVSSPMVNTHLLSQIYKILNNFTQSTSITFMRTLKA